MHNLNAVYAANATSSAANNAPSTAAAIPVPDIP